MMLFFSPITVFINILLIVIFWKTISVDSLILYSILIVMCIWSLTVVLKRVKLTTILLPLSLLLAYIISYALYPESRAYMFTSWDDLVGNPIYWFFLCSLPAFLFIRRIWNYDLLMKYLLNFALIATLCSFGTLVIYLSQDAQPGYMSFSYDLLFSAVMLLYGFFTKKKKRYLFGAIGAAAMMFFCGARGPMLCLLSALVLYILFMSQNQSSRILGAFCIIFITVVLLIFWDPVLNMFLDAAEALGIDSRILNKMVDGTLADDSGRSTVHDELVPMLNFLGYGLYGDRNITGGRYAHNMILELAIQYGLLVGSILIILLALLLIFGFFTKDREKRLLFLAFFCTGFVKLMMSSSYLSKEPALFCMLGICFSCYFRDDNKPVEKSKNRRLLPTIRLKRR